MCGYNKINSFTRRIHPSVDIMFYSIPSFSLTAIDTFIATWVLFFYEVVINIDVFFVMMTFAITRLLTLLLPPLIGYFSDRRYGSKRKSGKRFFWLFIPGLLVPVFNLLLFLPSSPEPSVGLYLFIFFILYNIFYVFYKINYSALLLNKFRHPKERLILSTTTNFIEVLGLLFVVLITPLLIISYTASSYRIAAIFVSIVFTITFLLGLLGFFEEEELIDTYYSPNLESQKPFFGDFFRRFAYAFKQKNFMLLLLRWLATAAFNLFFVLGMIYYSEYILEADPSSMTILYLIYYLMILVSIPIGFLISWFLGYLRTFNYSGLALGTTILMFTFIGIVVNPLIKSLISLLLMALTGFFTGLGFASLIPLAGDTFDESASINRKRSEGFLYGLLALFVSVMGIVQSFVSSLVHSFTGFIPDFYTPQPASAMFGIIILFSTIPGIIIIALQIVFMIFYDLKPEKVKSIQHTIKELQI